MRGAGKDRCQAHYTKWKDLQCTDSAAYFVTYFTDGSGGKMTCKQHLGQTVEHVLSDRNVGPGSVVKVASLVRVNS